ncbi:hypothetical protein Bca4012_021662 [Brassica carinata]
MVLLCAEVVGVSRVEWVIEVCVVSFVTGSVKEQCLCEWWFLVVVYQWLPAVLTRIVYSGASFGLSAVRSLIGYAWIAHSYRRRRPLEKWCFVRHVRGLRCGVASKACGEPIHSLMECLGWIWRQLYSYEVGCSWTDSISRLLSSGDNFHPRCVHPSENKIAKEIALSVTRDLRLQSYVAQGGPSWLGSFIAFEAVSSAIM